MTRRCARGGRIGSDPAGAAQTTGRAVYAVKRAMRVTGGMACVRDAASLYAVTRCQHRRVLGAPPGHASVTRTGGVPGSFRIQAALS